LKKKFLLTIIIITIIAPVIAFAADDAGIIVLPSVTYRQQSGTLGGDEGVLSVDLRGGYKIASGLYFGVIYQSTSGSGARSINGSAIGDSIGYFYGYFSLIASYYLTAKNTENTPTDYVARTEGSGIQVDAAITIPIASGLSFGPMLTYQNMTYNKRQDTTGLILQAQQSESYLYPFIAFAYQF
jgi:hypothetical protein